MKSTIDENNIELRKYIRFLAKNVSHLQDVKLIKLLYLAHLYHYSCHGEPLTPTHFFSQTFGPHIPVLRNIVDEEIDNSILYLMDARTSNDPTYSNPCKIIRSDEFDEGVLPETGLKTIRHIAEKWGEKEYKELLDYTSRTLPFIAAKYRDVIDFKHADKYPEILEVLSPEKRQTINKLIKDEPELEPSEIKDLNEHISIHEAVELYLQINGNKPEKIPGRKLLGIDIENLLEIFCSEGSEDNISLLAKRISMLFESMCFKNKTVEVGIRMMFLQLLKYGYEIDIDTLEDDLPEKLDYESINAWLNGIVAEFSQNQ